MDFVRSGREAIGGGGGWGVPKMSSSFADECCDDDEAVLPPKLYECDWLIVACWPATDCCCCWWCWWWCDEAFCGDWCCWRWCGGWCGICARWCEGVWWLPTKPPDVIKPLELEPPIFKLPILTPIKLPPLFEPCNSLSVGVLLGLLLLTRLNEDPEKQGNIFQYLKKERNSTGVSYSPECVVMAFVMYLELGLCLVVLSNHLSTSNTAWGFFFCSCLLMFEFISKRAQASGIP